VGVALLRFLPTSWRVAGWRLREPAGRPGPGRLGFGALAGIARGEVRRDVDATVAGNILRDTYLGTLYRWLGREPDPGFSLQETLLASLDVILHGLLLPGG
jgi:hypothetical protein